MYLLVFTFSNASLALGLLKLCNTYILMKWRILLPNASLTLVMWLGYLANIETCMGFVLDQRLESSHLSTGSNYILNNTVMLQMMSLLLM
jgi:hypothetical protein